MGLLSGIGDEPYNWQYSVLICWSRAAGLEWHSWKVCCGAAAPSQRRQGPSALSSGPLSALTEMPDRFPSTCEYTLSGYPYADNDIDMDVEDSDVELESLQEDHDNDGMSIQSE